MTETIGNEKRAGLEGREWLKKKLIPLLTLFLAIVIVVGIIYFYQNYPNKVDELRAYGYLGAFLISLIGNATIILHGGTAGIIGVLGATLPSATLVGLAGGVGAAIGEITGYMVGYSGRGIAHRSKMYSRVEGWMRKWGAMTVFVFSLVPFVFDLVGIAAGILRFPFWKFLLLCWVGRSLFYIGVAFAGALGFRMLLPYFG